MKVKFTKCIAICISFYLLTFTAKAQCPTIDFAMINSCASNSSGNEGVNEFLIFTTTATANASAYTLYYGSSSPVTSGSNASNIMAGTNARTKNGTGTITSASCPTSLNFVTTPSTSIPSGSRVIFIPSDFDQSYDFSNLCNGSPIYVVYIDIYAASAPSPVWNPGGSFANSPSAPRYVQVTNGGNNCTSNIRSFNNGWPANTDGNFVSWNSSGVATYGNNGCTFNAAPTITPSPITSVCLGSSSVSMPFTTTGTPDKYSITWNSATLAAGFINITNTTLPSSPLSISIPSAAVAGNYTGSLIVTNTTSGLSSIAQDISFTIKAIPAAPSVTTPISYCQNATSSVLTATGSGLLWYTNPTGGSGNTTSPTPSTGTTGTSNYYVSQTVNGCESPRATITVNIKAKSTSMTNASICSGSSYLFNGTTYTTAGTYTATLTNAAGCDSIATLVLTIKQKTNSTTNASICTGGSYLFNGTTYTTAGTYTATLTNAVGCDSIATLVLNIKQKTSSTTNAGICTGGSYLFNGTTYTTAGTYTTTLTNAVGCDSIATLVLTIKQKTSSTTNASICKGNNYLFNGTTYTIAGTYTATLTNAVGCDSLATLNLSLNPFKITLTATPIPATYGSPFTAQISSTSTITGSIWQPANLFVNNISSQTITAPDTAFLLKVIGISPEGCRDTANQNITVKIENDIVYIPNALIANSNANVDISSVKVYGNTVKTAVMMVYDQWGKMIFQSNNANIKGWDGTSNGKLQPAGVYIYTVKITFLNDKTTVKSGSINLIR
jgi:gliding motility-associated-like protein